MNMDLHLRLDEQDFDRASRASGIADPAKLVEHVLKEYVQLKARMELLRMGGTGGVSFGRPASSRASSMAGD